MLSERDAGDRLENFGDMDVIVDFSWRCLSASVAMTIIAVGRYLF